MQQYNTVDSQTILLKSSNLFGLVNPLIIYYSQIIMCNILNCITSNGAEGKGEEAIEYYNYCT